MSRVSEHRSLGERFPMTLRVRMVLICLAILIIALCGGYAAVKGAAAGASWVAATALGGMALALLAGCWPGPGWSDGEVEKAEQRVELEVEERKERNRLAWQAYYDAKDEQEARRGEAG